MLVEVRPLDLKKWHNKKGKDTFSMPKVVEALYDAETGKYATGLTEEEAAHYGKMLGVNLNDDFVADNPHPFWSTKPGMFKLENNTMFFNTDKALDFVRVKLMKKSKFVANSMKEWEEGGWPEATHVIFDEEEEVTGKASKIALRNQCIVALEKLSDSDKANLVQILVSKTVKGRGTDFINVEINAAIDNDPAEFLKHIRMGKEDVYARAAILEALDRNILVRDGGQITYMGEPLGFDVNEAVFWFKNPSNPRMKVAILEKLDSKRS